MAGRSSATRSGRVSSSPAVLVVDRAGSAVKSSSPARGGWSRNGGPAFPAGRTARRPSPASLMTSATPVRFSGVWVPASASEISFAECPARRSSMILSRAAFLAGARVGPGRGLRKNPVLPARNPGPVTAASPWSTRRGLRHLRSAGLRTGSRAAPRSGGGSARSAGRRTPHRVGRPRPRASGWGLVSLCQPRVQSSSCRAGRQPHPTGVSYIVVIQRVSLKSSAPSLRSLHAYDSEIDPQSAASADRTPIQIP
jgi:hypothetical protein